jgi:hypothetical protein
MLRKYSEYSGVIEASREKEKETWEIKARRKIESGAPGNRK